MNFKQLLQFLIEAEARPDYSAYMEIYDTDGDRMLRSFFSGKYTKQPWTVLPVNQVKKIWYDYMTMGIIRDENVVNNMADQMIENVVKLHVNTELTGHTQRDPIDVLNQFRDEYEDLWTEETREKFYEWIEDDKGQMKISDYALDPLAEDAAQLANHSTTAEQKIRIMDRMFNRIHPRGDIAALFIEGGSRSLTELSS